MLQTKQSWSAIAAFQTCAAGFLAYQHICELKASCIDKKQTSLDGRSIQLESSPYNRVKQLEEEPKSKPDLSQIIPKTRPNNNNIRLPVLPRQGVSYPITPHRDFFVPQPAEKPQHQNKARYRFMLQKLLQRDKESQNYTLAAICGNQGVMGADILRNKRIVNTSPAGKNKYPWFAPVGGGVSLEGIRPWFESRPKPQLKLLQLPCYYINCSIINPFLHYRDIYVLHIIVPSMTMTLYAYQQPNIELAETKYYVLILTPIIKTRMMSLKDPPTILIPKNPFHSRLHRKKTQTSWNPLVQPLNVHEFMSLGIYPQHLHSAGQKLCDIKAKLPPTFVRDQLKTWFSTLPLAGKVSALTLRAPLITWLIKHMYTRSTIFGDSLFSFEVSGSALSYTVSPDRAMFCLHPKVNAERELIVGIRLADDKEPFDCLSVASDLVENSKAFFQIMQDASGGKFGLKACCIAKAENFYTWELPGWFDYSKANTVGSWICANIERILWLRYALFLTQTKIETQLTPLKDQDGLTEFWKNLDEKEKKLVLSEAIGKKRSGEQGDLYQIESEYRLKEAAISFDPGKFIEWLLFIPLSDISIHEVQCAVLNEIRKAKSNKVASELLNEEGNTSDSEKVKVKGVVSDPEDFTGKTIQSKTKKLKSDSGSKPTSKKRPKKKKPKKTPPSKEEAPIDEQEEVAINITSNIIVGVLSKIEEEEDEEEKKAVKPVPPPPLVDKPKPEEKKDPPLLDAAAVEVNYYKSTHKTSSKGSNRKHFYAITDEINAICKNLQQYKKRQEPYRKQLISTLERKIKSTFGAETSIQLYGSTQSNLAIECSDIDIGITGLSLYSHQDAEESILKLETVIKSEPYIRATESITTARVPVLKLSADMNKLFEGEKLENFQKVDIVASDQHYYPVERGVQTTEFSKALLKRFKFLREVTVVLKKLLAKQELNVPYKGGINSYAILLLSAAYYTIYPEFRTAGEYLLGILDFYAKYFNNMLYGVCFNGEDMYFLNQLITYSTYFPLVSPVDHRCLVVLDPFDPSSNITAGLYRFDEIRKCFSDMLSKGTLKELF
eukprot:TRINITY_DN67_c0_g1_i1.p1 TRINITY_DN67_c0_g1~~TRINITY_DN67_c0_g1_i1.p1  ORF type:complete len:1062 (-),score=106.09 TRINITY_DN67_c0_g1_i1:1462-4647(-)